MLISFPSRMSLEEFYITLPSNASVNIFKENTLHSYLIKLQRPLSVQQGKWVVGMTEIQFPHSWKNLVNGYVKITKANYHSPLTFHLKDGHYKSIDDLLTSIHHILTNAKLEKEIILYYDNIRNQVLLEIMDNPATSTLGVTFSQNILNMLGLRLPAGGYFSTGLFAGQSADITEGFSALFFYCDIVQNQLVGDVMVPLLRVIPIRDHKMREVEWVEFQHVQYLSIGHTQTDIVEINIRRDNGDTIPFQYRKVVITLHFKQIK